MDHLLSLFPLFPDHLFEQIKIETNQYYEQNKDSNKPQSYGSWLPVDKEEIKAYIGVVIAMDIVNLADIPLFTGFKVIVRYHGFHHSCQVLDFT